MINYLCIQSSFLSKYKEKITRTAYPLFFILCGSTLNLISVIVFITQNQAGIIKNVILKFCITIIAYKLLVQKLHKFFSRKVLNFYLKLIKKQKNQLIQYAFTQELSNTQFKKKYTHFQKYVNFYINYKKYSYDTLMKLFSFIFIIILLFSYYDITLKKVTEDYLLISIVFIMELFFLLLFVKSPRAKPKEFINYAQILEIQRLLIYKDKKLLKTPNMLENNVKFYYVNLSILHKIILLIICASILSIIPSKHNEPLSVGAIVIIYLFIYDNLIALSIAKMIIFYQLKNKFYPPVYKISKIRKYLNIFDRRMHINTIFPIYYLSFKQYNITLKEFFKSMGVNKKEAFFILHHLTIFNDQKHLTFDLMDLQLSEIWPDKLKKIFLSLKNVNKVILHEDLLSEEVS